MLKLYYDGVCDGTHPENDAGVVIVYQFNNLFQTVSNERDSVVRQAVSYSHTALHHTALHHTALHHTALHHTALHHTALHHTALHHTALHHTALHHTGLWVGNFHSFSIFAKNNLSVNILIVY